MINYYVASGISMFPFIKNGDILVSYADKVFHKGDVVVVKSKNFYAHRIVCVDSLITKGDNHPYVDNFEEANIYGKISLLIRNKRAYNINQKGLKILISTYNNIELAFIFYLNKVFRLNFQYSIKTVLSPFYYFVYVYYKIFCRV